MHTLHDEGGHPISLPDGDKMNGDKVGYYSIPSCSKEYQRIHMFKDLNSATLISLGQLVDERFTSHLDIDRLLAKIFGIVVLVGTTKYQDKSLQCFNS